MSKISGIRLSEIRETSLKEALLAVEESCMHFDVDFYIIGALARDIWFAEDDISVGGTKDVDLAALVSAQDQFQNLKSRLINDHKFKESANNAFVLFAPNGIQIDILPFGALEVEDGVAVDGKGMNHIKVNGFKEVYEASIKEIKVLENKTYKVATLPGIVLLKLIAYDDRPEQRGKDPLDILTIIEHFFDLQSDLIYDSHNDLFGDEEFSKQKISCRVIGREMRSALAVNAELKTRVLRILDEHIEKAEKSNFIHRMISEGKYSVDECADFLKKIKTGTNQAI